MSLGPTFTGLALRIAVGCLVVASLVGCAPAVNTGPMVGSRENRIRSCGPLTDRGNNVFGYWFTNTGDEPATITELDLVEPQGLVEYRFFVPPIVIDPDGTHNSFAGANITEPDDERQHQQWADRVDAIGYVAQPGEDVNVVTEIVAVEPAATSSPKLASAKALRMTYSVGRTTFTELTSVEFVLATTCTPQ